MPSFTPRSGLICLALFLAFILPLLWSQSHGLAGAGLFMGLLSVLTSPWLALGLMSQGALSCLTDRWNERLALLGSGWLVVLVSLCSRLPHEPQVGPHLVQLVAILGFGWLARSLPNGRFAAFAAFSLLVTLFWQSPGHRWTEATDAGFLLVGSMLAVSLLLLAGLALGLTLMLPWLPERQEVEKRA